MQADAGSTGEPGSPSRPDWLARFDHNSAYGWARIAWDRASPQPGARFDAELAQTAVDLWSKYFVLTEDRFAGVPFRLNGWQEIIVRLLVGWLIPSEVTDPTTGAVAVVWVRLFQELRLWVPRKNGKSEFLAALALFFFVLDGVMRGQGYCFARDEKQAKIVLTKMKDMVGYSDALRSNVSPYAKSIYVPKLKSGFEVLSGSEEGKHGRSASVIVGDEMHEWRSLELKNTLRQSTGARLEPMGLYASTAGLKSNPVGYLQWEESQQLLDGRIDDPTTLVVIFAAEPDADIFDEAVWAFANPSLGLSPTLRFLRREAALAKDNPRQEAHFRRYHLNQWVDSAVRWLNLKRWDLCTDDVTSWSRLPEKMRGRRCYAALDVSSTQDVTALILLFPPEEGGERWTVIPIFWLPEEVVAKRVADDRVSYDRWVTAGALRTTPGDYVDQNFALKGLEWAAEEFELLAIGFDPWNAAKLVADAQAAGFDPELFVAMRQGIPTLGEPTKEFERMVYAAQLDHGGHPVLRWMAGNAVVKFDENMNFKPSKQRSLEKIDGIVAGVMAVGLSMGDYGPEPSVYEERGLLEIEVD